MPFPGIPRAALFERLARGQAERLTVLTPNRRLARALEAEVDALELAAGRTSWEAPDILAFPAFVERSHEAARYSAQGAGLPSLLTDLAARILWEEAIRASEWHDKVLSVAGTAALAAEAWSLAHQWRIDTALRDPSAGEDALAFAGWAEHYARRLARDNLVDSAQLPAHTSALMAAGAIDRPGQIVAYAFDVLAPQQSDFLEACVRAGIAVATCDADPGQPGGEARRLVLESPRAELEHAVRWARARLESAGEGTAPRIGIIVPDLQKRRQEALRIFARTLVPAMPPPGAGAAPLFGLSLGLPLASYPLVDAAFALLELASGAVAYDRASRLLRSPFIDGSEAEEGDRARLDAALRRIVPAELNLLRLRTSISQAVLRQGAPECPGFTRLVDRVLEATQDQGRAAPHEWARRFTRVLDAAGFPGERTLDSAEYQTLVKWGEALRDLAALGIVAPAWSGADARSRLQRLCAETIFQPETGEAPVQVLGLLESPGLAFDHLWVCGLTEDAWPLAARPHPLIAPALQRRAGIPQASPEAALDYDRHITAGWLRAAPEVVFSSARMDGERELLPSPLTTDVAAVDPAQVGIPKFPELRRELLRVRRIAALEPIPDDHGPRIATPLVKGGARVLVDQAACPFRAFAHFRLDAHALEHPEHGLGPLERGTLLHEMMGRVWEVLEDQATLKATSEDNLAKITRDAAHHAIERVRQDRPGRLDGHFAELEQERLALVAREWLALERDRPAFTVTLREEKVRLHAGDVQLEGRIDRMDVLEGGGRVVIDYKSGMVSVASWLGARPDDAQLPLYALALGHEEVDAVAFARMKTGQRAFVGLARDAAVGIRGVTPIQKHKGAGKIADTWSGLFTSWEGEVRVLGENFAAGDALVDPKELLLTCRRCDLKSLCRVHERLGALDEGEEEDDAPEEGEA